MATARDFDRSRSDAETDFYLPAASVSTALDRLESYVSKFTRGHGVVLIPDTYNK